jgi:hypothetical protein
MYQSHQLGTVLTCRFDAKAGLISMEQCAPMGVRSQTKPGARCRQSRSARRRTCVIRTASYMVHTAAAQRHVSVTVCSAAAGCCRAEMMAKGTSRKQLVASTSAGGDGGDGGGGIGVHGFPLNCRGAEKDVRSFTTGAYRAMDNRSNGHADG